jgi:mono/diheme cytochrome c family protein
MKAATAVAYLVSGLSVVICVTVLLAAARPAQEVGLNSQKDQQTARLIPSLDGADMFHAYCAPCHGADGKGDGPVAPALNTRLPDLTTISKRHGGIFPALRIEQIISGDELIFAHGSREMPIWGPIFHQIESDRDLGNVRLHNLTRYLQTIQAK